MWKLLIKCLWFAGPWLAFQIAWNAALDWSGSAVAKWLGITSPTVSDIYKLFVEISPPLVGAAIAFYLYHLWWSREQMKNLPNHPNASPKLESFVDDSEVKIHGAQKEGASKTSVIGEIAAPSKALLVHSTKHQTTTLKVTDRGLECHVMDSRRGKVSGTVWVVSGTEVPQILLNQGLIVSPGFNAANGTFSIGSRPKCEYSKSLHPDSCILKSKLHDLLKSVQ